MNASAHLRLDAYFGSKRTRPLNEFFYLALSIELREVIPPPKLVPLFFKLWKCSHQNLQNVPFSPWVNNADPTLIYLAPTFATEPNTGCPASLILEIQYKFWTPLGIHFRIQIPCWIRFEYILERRSHVNWIPSEREVLAIRKDHSEIDQNGM